MQDIHTLTTGVGGVSGGILFGDRRLRQHGGSHPNNQQCLKCPRCNSLNTKFCYYNNYNLSQPRYFCKNCRRYWTKGGVLRNVPVGGGCRKPKRSSRPKAEDKHQAKSSSEDKAGLQSHSSSESSNTTNTNITGNTNKATNTINTLAFATTAPGAGSGSCGIFQISHTDFLNLDPLIDTNSQVGGVDSGGGGGDGGHILYPDQLDGFMGLMNNNSSNNNSSNNNVSTSGCFDGVNDGNGTTSFGQFMNTQVKVDWDFGKIGETHEVQDVDPTARMDDLMHNRGCSGGLTTLDWLGQTANNGHHGLFDLLSTVDHQSYWSYEVAATTNQHHHSHWSDNVADHSLFLH